MKKKSAQIISLLNNWNFKIMLSLLISLIAIPSFGRYHEEQDLLVNIMFTIVLFVSSACLISNLKLFFWSLFLGITGINLTWIQYRLPWEVSVSLLLYFTYTLFFLILLVHIIKTIFRSTAINLNLIFGALNGYIIIGLIGCFLMIFLNINYEDSFRYEGNNQLSNYDFIYYSFINLTTLGFGDILPVCPQAKALSVIHALFGQLYLTVIVAMMVGKFSNKQ